jgi:hypothetical protein
VNLVQNLQNFVCRFARFRRRRRILAQMVERGQDAAFVELLDRQNGFIAIFTGDEA